MAIQTSKKGQIFNEINITPLTDIFLVLLIIMMVIAPMFQSVDKNIKMPEINSGLNVDEDKTVISITKDAEFYVDSKRIDPAALESEMANIVKETGQKIVVVRADTNTKNKEIMKVMRAAQSTGIEKLIVAGEPLNKQQQQVLEDENKNSQGAG